MKVNLRKASVIQSHIQAEISRLYQVEATVQVNLYESNIEDLLVRQCQSFQESEQLLERLYRARQELRTELAQANVMSGIHALLAEDSTLALRETYLNKVTSRASPRLSSEGVLKLAENMVKQEASDYQLSFDVLPAETISHYQSQLTEVRRRRRRLKDEMVTINVQSELTLSDEVATLLAELGLD